LEEKQRERWEEAGRDGGPGMEKVASFNQMLSGALERVNELKEEVEERRTRTGTKWG
jgi:flagellar hook-basal body complex protein FliE